MLSMARANSVFVFLAALFLNPLDVSSWKGLIFANKYKKRVVSHPLYMF